MSHVYFETEHQELFYLDADLRCPIHVHIPSALGTLGYYVCLRVPTASLDQLGGVITRLQIGGLRPDDVTLRFGGGVQVPARYASVVAGHSWVLLCRASVSRGDGTVSFTNVPATLDRAHLLLCTWPRFISSGQADEWIACQADPYWASGGVPLGGIGCGKVELSRDGRFRNFSGNNNQDMPFEEPDGLAGAFLTVGLGSEERVLATRPALGIPPVASLEATLSFPQVTLSAGDAFPGIDVDVCASGPIIPDDLRLSSLPGFVVRWRVHNRTSAPVEIRCRLAWPNLVGRGGGIGEPETRVGYADGFYRYWDAPDQPAAQAVQGTGFLVLKYANAASPVSPSADGHHYVAVAGTEGCECTADARLGSVSRTLRIAPDGKATADMAIVWEMPHWIDTLGKDQGMYWQNTCADGMEILQLLFDHFDAVLTEGGALDALLQQTDLPDWLKSRLTNCCYPLVTNSVFLRDGRFSVNEGPTEMAGCYGTLDQRLGAHPATQLLFPELNERELRQFAAYQSPNGGVNHDFGGGHLDSGPRDQPWPDLTCSFILQLARHAWSTGDARFDNDHWPRARKALLRHREWADAGNGVAQVGYGLGTSYDGYHYFGTTPYVATLWIAALQVARRWAVAQGDAELPPIIDSLVERARQRMEADLWNGRYYRTYRSSSGETNESCHAGLVAGEYYARMLAGEDVLAADRLDACAQTFLAFNGSERFGVPPDEVSPDGKGFSEFGWLPYVECFGLAPLAVRGDLRVLPVWRRIVQAMDGEGAHPCDTRLMYQPVSGAPSWGAYYMTAPASWLVYDALLDFFFSPAEGALRLAPRLNGRFAVVHPLFWGVGTTEGSRVSLHVTKVRTERALWVRLLDIPAPVSAVHMHGQALRQNGTLGVYRRYAVEPFQMKADATLAWDVTR